MGQSSNDVIPTAIHVSAYLLVAEDLLPSLQHVKQTLDTKAAEIDDVVTTGRTHLMDAMPVRLSQILGGWSSQIAHGIDRRQRCHGWPSWRRRHRRRHRHQRPPDFAA
ncbi:MAG: lyase family protein [Caldilineaceae bacterium]